MSDVILLTVENVVSLVKKIGISQCFKRLNFQLKYDFSNWEKYQLSPRHATHFSDGVIELMPFSNEKYYSFKYVNGHPINTKKNKQCVFAFGALSKISDGYPLMISEMSLLTALRTAATSALASHYLTKPNVKIMGIIGTGAQSEFQALSHHFLLGIETIRYFDIDPFAMHKFSENLKKYPIKLIACSSIEEVVNESEIITTLTADKSCNKILTNSMIQPGVHINAVGGDCPGKVELDPKILERSKVIVEYTKQSRIEGEIQNSPNTDPYAELWEIITGNKIARSSNDDITIFDSVGIGMEDFSVLLCFYELSKEYNIGNTISIIPKLEKNIKNLFSLLR